MTSSRTISSIPLLAVAGSCLCCLLSSSLAAQDSIRVESAILKTIETTTLAAEVPGTIRELQVKEGDVVEAGENLGNIKDEAVRLELVQLKTQIEMARKKQANDINQRLAEKGQQVANNEYQRALNANARVPDTYPINEIDRLKLVTDQAQLEVERAQHDQEIAAFEVSLALGNYRKTYELYTRHQIVAPAAGVVVSVEKRTGEWVEPGTDLLRIVRIDPLRVEGFIAASELDGDLVGHSAKVKLIEGKNEDSVTGHVVFVSPDVNPASSQVRVFIEVDNATGKLRPGLRVNATIEKNVGSE